MTTGDAAERVRTRTALCGEMPAFLAVPQAGAEGSSSFVGIASPLDCFSNVRLQFFI